MFRRHPFWTLLFVSAALAVVYASTSVRVVGGELIPPLDDAFIHFQYARRIAEGHPFTYQAGDGYSSGATSLIWPFLLAIGYLLGFTAESLYVWAIGLGAVFLATTAFYTHRWLGRVAGERTALLGTALLFCCGPLMWGAFSGMEVLLCAAAMSALLDGLTRTDRAPGAPAPGMLLWGGILAVARPEGAVLVGLLFLAQVLDAWLQGGRRAAAVRPALAFLAPVSLGGVQPLLNLVNTGMLASASALAKRNPRFVHAGETVAGEFVWKDLINGGYGVHFFGPIAVPVLILFAVGAWTLALRERGARRPGVATVGLVWWIAPMPLLALVLPITWHHFRYLLPGLAVYLPFVAVGASAIDGAIARLRGGSERGGEGPPFVLGTLVGCLALASTSWPNELGRNARDIRGQQVELARWVARAVPPDARVAANDVGAIAYLGGHRILDLEGIVSLEYLDDALEGEGSLMERAVREKPDLFVVFPDWFDSSFAAGLFEVRRRAFLDDRSISGGEEMVVATLSPSAADMGTRPPDLAAGERVIDTLNVSDRADETGHAVTYEDIEPWRGRMDRVVTGTYASGDRVVDTARRLEGGMTFTVDRGAGPARLIGRFGPSEGASRLFVRVNGADAGIWDLPPVAQGRWAERAFDLPPGAGRAEVEILPVDVARPRTRGGWNLARLWSVAKGAQAATDAAASEVPTGSSAPAATAPAPPPASPPPSPAP